MSTKGDNYGNLQFRFLVTLSPTLSILALPSYGIMSKRSFFRIDENILSKLWAMSMNGHDVIISLSRSTQCFSRDLKYKVHWLESMDYTVVYLIIWLAIR